MIALDGASQNNATQDVNARFLAMLPAIQRQAEVAFRDWPGEARDELVAETVDNAYVAFLRLCRRGRRHVAYPTPLARFAVRQVRAGRQVGTKMNIADVTSRYCQLRKELNVERLDRYDREEPGWLEIVIEDKRATPAEIAAMRIDFAEWMASLPQRLRQIANTLATGETTLNAARQYGVSPGRISQIRRELRRAWEDFQGEPAFA